MEGEDLINAADVAAPEQEIVTAPESVEPDPSQESEKEAKTFTQEELEAAIGKRLAKERRKMEREFAAKQTQPVQPSNEPLTLEQFETPEAFIEALADRKAQEKVQQQQLQQRQTEIEATYAERVEAVMEKYDDFEQVAYSHNHRVTPEMAAVIKESEVGPDIAYWLGLNPKESNRIASLTPLQQAREIGKIEAKIAVEPIVKKTSSAPEPIKPVTANRATATTYDTTDPRSTKAMSDSEWIRAEEARVRRNLEARNR